MSMEVDFSEPYLEMTDVPATPSLAPQFMEVTIAGRPYVMDTSFEPYRRDAFRHRSIQAQRESINLDNIPGVGTVNTEGLWRREAWDWHYGAGQPYQDRKDSVDNRFSISKGINPWMQWQVELLSDTKLMKAVAGNAQVIQAGGYLWLLDKVPGATVMYYSNDGVTWTNPGGFPTDMTMITTDGHTIWAATDGTNNGIFQINFDGSGGGFYVTAGDFDGVWYVGDRLMATAGPNVYNIITSGGVPAALWTHPNPNWKWTTMAEGSSQIYLSGYSATGGASNSVVYRTTIEATGTALTVPVQALPMEGGEWCTSLYGYLNYIFVGSNLGVRMCRTLAAYDPTGNQGDLEAGPLIPGLFPPGPVSNPVQAMTGNNRFVYFSWTDYDSVSTGLGRCDLSTFIDTQAPAFASDLMVTGQGNVESMAWNPIDEYPCFVVQGMGLYTGSGVPVESGYVQSGYYGYDISDNKIVMGGALGTIQPQQGTVTFSLAADTGNNIFSLVGQQNSSASGGTPNQNVFAINPIRGDLFTVQVGLQRDPTTNESPVLQRWTLKALPAVASGTTISVVLRIWETEEILGQDNHWDPYVEKAFLENLRVTQTLFEYTEGPFTAPFCTVDEIDWLPEKKRDAQPEGGYQGNIIVYIKTWSAQG